MTGLLPCDRVEWVASPSWIRCHAACRRRTRTMRRSAGASRRATSRRWPGPTSGGPARCTAWRYGPSGPGRTRRTSPSRPSCRPGPDAADSPRQGSAAGVAGGGVPAQDRRHVGQAGTTAAGDGGGHVGGTGCRRPAPSPRAWTPPSPTGSCCSTNWISWASPSAGSSSWRSSRTSRTRRSPCARACRSARSRATSGAPWSACGHGWRWTVQHCTPGAARARRAPRAVARRRHRAPGRLRAVPGRGGVPPAGRRRARRPPAGPPAHRLLPPRPCGEGPSPPQPA